MNDFIRELQREPERAENPGQNNMAIQAQDLLRQHRADEFEEDRSDLTSVEQLYLKNERSIAAHTTLWGSAIAGAFQESASLGELASLQASNPLRWGNITAQDLPNVRGYIRNNIRNQAVDLPYHLAQQEKGVLTSTAVRGFGKGLALGAGSLVGAMAVDVLAFGDTPRTSFSKFVDIAAIPALAYVVPNAYVRAGAYVAVHTAARLYDKYST